MTTDVLDVIKNIKQIYENNSSLSVLKDFERVLDELDLYVYDNWIDGEIAYGPKVDRHWVTVGLMFPLDKMPDPVGGKRLTDIGCKVTFQKSHLVIPRKITKQADIRPGTKKGKLDRHPIWIVECQMPKEVAFDMYRGYMEKIKAETIHNEAPKSKAPIANTTAAVAPIPPAGMPASPVTPPPAAG